MNGTIVSPAASAGPDPSSSAASTPPISSAGSDVEPADIGAGDQSDVDGRNSEASSPDAIVISDTSDAEGLRANIPKALDQFSFQPFGSGSII